MPELSVVVPSLERPEAVERLVASLGEQDGADFELIVASNAADPDPGATAAKIEGAPFPARHVRGGVPGAAAARNAGIDAATAPVVLFLNDDVRAAPALLARHLERHSEHPEPEVGVLGDVRWARELDVTPFMRWLEHGVQFSLLGIEGEQAGWGRFYTINASVKRELLERVGGFDESFPFLYEDLEIARRMHDHGFSLLWEPRAAVEHVHQVEFEAYRERMRETGAAARRFEELHPDVEIDLRARFERALALPPASSRGAKLLGLMPRALPVLGERMWTSADRYFCQALGPYFLEGWRSGASASGPK